MYGLRCISWYVSGSMSLTCLPILSISHTIAITRKKTQCYIEHMQPLKETTFLPYSITACFFLEDHVKTNQCQKMTTYTVTIWTLSPSPTVTTKHQKPALIFFLGSFNCPAHSFPQYFGKNHSARNVDKTFQLLSDELSYNASRFYFTIIWMY